MDTEFRIHYGLRAFALCVIVLALAYIDRFFRLDDALIYARYVRNALQGHGLVYNVGEPVNALTSILDTWLLLGVSWLLRGNILLAQQVIGASCLMGAALIAEDLVPLAGIFIAASSYFYFCIGMETSLFLLLLVLCLQAYLRGWLNWLPLLSILVILARFEGGALVLVIAWRLWQQRRYPRWPSLLPAVLLIGFYLVSNLHNYGVLLPQSATAKFGQGMSGFWGKWPRAFTHIDQYVWLPIFGSRMIAPVLLLLVWLAARDRRLHPMNKVLLPFLGLLGSFYILFNIPSYFWYYAPFLYFSYLYAAHLIPATKPARLVALFFAACLVNVSAATIKTLGVQNTSYANMATWIMQNSPASARIATTETGTIGWYCDRNIIDMVGLTTPANAKYTAHRDFSSWFKARPDFVVVHPEIPFPWEKVALASPDYDFAPVHFGNVYLLRRRSDPATANALSR